MRVIVCENYDEVSAQAAKIIASQIILKPDCVLGLATGSTPIGTYQKLIEMNKSGYIDFSEITTFNLDEYYPIKQSNDQSYNYFMKENLFNHINIDQNKTFIPNGEAIDAELECEQYEKKIFEHGGVDLQVLGIGQNGHIGFNEPSENLKSKTHITELTEDTIDANARFFTSRDEVPTKALTMGISTILSAKTIIILASGKGKHDVVKELVTEYINTQLPASILKVHSAVVLICDKAAFEGE